MPVLSVEQSKTLEEKMKAIEIKTAIKAEAPVVEKEVAEPIEIVTVEAPVAETPKPQKRKSKKK